MNIPLWARRSVLAAGLMMAAGTAQAAAQNSDILVNIDRAVRTWQDGAYVDNPNATQGPEGGTFIYTGKIKHNAGEPVTNSKLYMELPVGAIYKGRTSSPSGISCTNEPGIDNTIDAGTVIICDTGSLNTDGTFKTVSFEVVLPDIGTDWITYAYGSIDNEFEDYDPTNNERSSELTRTFTTYAAADLGVEVEASRKTGIDTTSSPDYEYTIKVTNHGPSSIPSDGKAVVTFQIPSGAQTTSSFDENQSGWHCAPSGSLNPNTNVTCTYTAISEITGGTELLEITVPVQAIMGGDIGFSVNVRGLNASEAEMSDGQLENNSRGVTVTATGTEFTDIALQKTASTAFVDALDGVETEVTYTLEVTRTGGSLNPEGIVVTDNLPAGMTFTEFAGDMDSGWSCDYTSGSATFSCAWDGGNEWSSGINDKLPLIRLFAFKGVAGF